MAALLQAFSAAAHWLLARLEVVRTAQIPILYRAWIA